MVTVCRRVDSAASSLSLCILGRNSQFADETAVVQEKVFSYLLLHAFCCCHTYHLNE